jgi:hypothetical protein
MTAGLLSFGRTVVASPTFQITWVNADNTWVNAPAGWTTVRNQFTTDMGLWFSTTINIVIDIGYNTVGGGALGGGGSSIVVPILPTYADVKAAMIANSTYASGTLPSSLSNGSGSMASTSPLGQALGLNGPNPVHDGSVGFSSSTTWDLSTDGSCAAGHISLYGEYVHEVFEVMGRVWTNDSFTSAQGLFSFTAPATRNETHLATRYFSDDNGTTNLGAWNHVANGGDYGDWNQLGDCCDYQNTTGQSGVPTLRDMRVMAAMGWNLTAAGRTLAGI